MKRITVYKIGGSLFDSPKLPDWLRHFAGRSGIVIVPGGGPFADQVRLAQKRWGFDDLTAHRMAVLAMRQYGQMLLGLEPGLEPWRLGERLPESAVVWLPEPEVLDREGIPGSWEITSDSLAAWLANRLEAEELVLIKSHPSASGSDLKRLQALGIIDRAFDVYSGGLRWRVCHRDEIVEWEPGP